MEGARAEQGRITGELTLRQKDFLKGRDVCTKKTGRKGEPRERETQRRLSRESRQVIGGGGGSLLPHVKIPSLEKRLEGAGVRR